MTAKTFTSIPVRNVKPGDVVATVAGPLVVERVRFGLYETGRRAGDPCVDLDGHLRDLGVTASSRFEDFARVDVERDLPNPFDTMLARQGSHLVGRTEPFDGLFGVSVADLRAHGEALLRLAGLLAEDGFFPVGSQVDALGRLTYRYEVNLDAGDRAQVSIGVNLDAGARAPLFALRSNPCRANPAPLGPVAGSFFPPETSRAVAARVEALFEAAL